MRVTHIISNLGIGGAEAALCTLVEALADEPVAHTVISMLPGGVLSERLRRSGAQVIELAGKRSLATASMLPRVGQALEVSRPDVVQGWMYHGNIAASAAVALRYVRAPVLWGVRQTVARLSDDRLATRAIILAGSVFGRQPAAIVYNSRQAAVDHERLLYPASRRHVLPNAVDCDRFRPSPGAGVRLREALGLGKDACLVGRLGRNAAMKDNATLFRATACALKTMPDLHLVLVGPDMTENDPSLKALAAETGLSGHVHYLGPRLDIETLYPGFDLVVSSSRSTEGFPNVVAETMASATPVVATDVGETKAILGDDRFLVRPGDVEALADAIRATLMLRPQERRAIGAEMRRSIERRFSAREIGRRYLDLWTQFAR